MRIINRMLKQYAVYWSPGSIDLSGNVPIYGEPIEIKCRWEDVQEQFIDRNGQVRASKSKVYVDRDLEVGGYLWQGELANIESPNLPESNDGAYQIMAVNKIPTLNAKQFLRFVML